MKTGTLRWARPNEDGTAITKTRSFPLSFDDEHCVFPSTPRHSRIAFFAALRGAFAHHPHTNCSGEDFQGHRVFDFTNKIELVMGE